MIFKDALMTTRYMQQLLKNDIEFQTAIGPNPYKDFPCQENKFHPGREK
jgi:hypothetical protein